MLAAMVVLGVLVTMFIGFLIYVYAPVNVYGRDLSRPRQIYNQRMEQFSKAKQVGTIKSYAQSRSKTSEYKTMIENFSKGLDINGKPLYDKNSDSVYQAFGLNNV